MAGLLAGCAPLAAGRQPAGGSSAAAPAAPPSSTSTGPARRATLTVFAAASLTVAFGELAREFESAHPGTRVTLNFAGSQQLRAQLEQGARADVFASANTKEMDSAIAASLVVSGTPRVMARNRLVIIYPKDNPGKIRALADLARPGLKLDIADKSVPAGQYTLDMLARLSNDPAHGPDFARRVAANVVSHENDVEAVVSKVRLGEADAGVVYATDVTPGAIPPVGALPIPDQFNQVATYPIAPLARSRQPELAAQFVGFVLSPGGQAVLARHGFITGTQ